VRLVTSVHHLSRHEFVGSLALICMIDPDFDSADR
jgi:hypothetical protein